jgi:hypothetical protein
MSSLSIHDVTDHQAVVTTDYSLARINRVAEFAKARHNSGNHLALGDDKFVATLDAGIIHAWCAKRGVTFSQLMCDQKLTVKMLEDPDLSVFRIWKGKI